MAEVEDWQPVAQQQPAPADDWQPVGGTQQAPQPDLELNPATGRPYDEIPEAFAERSRVGQAVNRVMARMAKEAQEGFGDSTPTSLSDETLEHLIQAGVFHDPARGRPGALQLMNEATILPLAKLWDGLGRSISGGLYGAGGLIAQLHEELGGEQGMAERAKRETINFGNWAMIETGFGGFVRPYAGRFNRALREQTVGRLPAAQDFTAAAEALGAPEANLQRLWQEKGIHPAEAVADAERDAWAKHQITAPIEAYHGSPHDFEAFSIENVGTGEGAQSFGHGLYMAEAKAVGEDYAKQLGGPLYQVRIHANRDHFIDWDKPLNEQTQHVQDALRSVLKEEIDWSQPASKFIRDLGYGTAQTNVLRDAGIPGVKYLDQKSRVMPTAAEIQAQADHVRMLEDAAKANPNLADALPAARAELERLQRPETRNFVVFDDSAIEITHKNGTPFYDKRFQEADAERRIMDAMTGEPDRLSAVGAEVTTDPPMVPLAKEPLTRPGSLADAAREGMDQLLGLGKNIQFMLDPMATGSKRAMVIAKDAISTVRRIRWEHARVDNELLTNTGLKEARKRVGETVEQQHDRMWRAADEESVAIQLGESREHLGLVTLEPEERAMVELLHTRAQAAWLHAVDAGLVEGDGLPAYTPRMVLNVAVAGEHGSPQALNELGRNVFTRTSQMRHRSHMTAEETEAAAKELVRKQMEDQGASAAEIASALEKVKIASNIRSLPLASARLEEAAVWKEMINKIEDVGKAAGETTVSAGFKPGNDWFTIAGNPAFTKWMPAMEKNPITGKWGTRTDDAGNVLFVPTPIYMSGEFRGPMKAILDEGPSANKAVQGAQSLYGALMAIKGRAMLAILNSPLIHNAVVWSKVMEAAGGRELFGFGLYWKGNRLISSNPGRASELIERGLSPMGPRGSFQDITSIMENPSLLAGHHESLTGKVLAFAPGLFDEAAGVATEKAISTAGNFWHNTLLWDRVRDVQFGLADHLSDRLVAKGADRLTADRVAAHFSNIIVGSIPKEAMSAGARATANLLLFSRSFTLGNLSTFKQAALGLPKPIMAQIERDFGISADAALGEAGLAEASKTARSISRRKAISTIMLSAGLYYIGNAIWQHAFNITIRDATVDDEMRGYARRYHDLMTAVKEDPAELRHLISRLSPTYDNEPEKQDRALIGHDRSGTAIYGRNPTGKFGEEMVGYPTMPLTMLRRKLSPLAGGILDIMENDKGFGRKIYDENDRTIGGDAKNAFAIAKHLVMKHLPEQQIMAAVDLLHEDGDTKVNAMRLLGPMAGFTASVGAPGGPARGEQLSAKRDFDARFNLAWPDIRKQIQRGDIEGAHDALTDLKVPQGMQRALIRNAINPAGALHGRTLRDFYQYATPEQLERFGRARQAPAP